MSAHAGQLAPTPRRVALASAVGATIEWYDFFLYGTAAAVVFDKPETVGRSLDDASARRGLERVPA